MSRLIYDNRERLVDAVLKEEQLRQLAYAESRSPSACSDPSSQFSLSFDDVSFTFSSPVSDQNTSRESPSSGKDILPVVETWLQKTDGTRTIKHQIIDPRTPWVLRLIPGISSVKPPRYFRSRKAKKGAEFIVNHASTPSLASRKLTEDNVIEAMREGEDDVGKTMIAKPIMEMNRAREKGLFDEWVEQFEPGVYITLTSLLGGLRDLKRVRLSRKRFSEMQAKIWYAENRARVYELYNVRMVEKSSVGVGSLELVQ